MTNPRTVGRAGNSIHSRVGRPSGMISQVRWPRLRVKAGAALMALLIAAGVGSAPHGSVAGAADSAGAHRTRVACQYVYQTYSGLFQRPLKGLHPGAFSEKVADAASPVLRKELVYWKAAKAFKNWAGTDEAGVAMVNTCDHLGLSRLD